MWTFIFYRFIGGKIEAQRARHQVYVSQCRFKRTSVPPQDPPSHQRTIQVLLALTAHQSAVFGAKRAATLWQQPAGPISQRSDSQLFAILYHSAAKAFYFVPVEVNITRFIIHQLVRTVMSYWLNTCKPEETVVLCVSRACAPQWGSLTCTLSRGPLNARDVGDLHGGCGGKKDRSVNTDMKSLSFRKWKSSRSSWIIFSEMIFLPMLWFLSQTRAAPSITTEQMDMGVVGAHSSLSSE